MWDFEKFDTCDGQQGRLLFECANDFKLAFADEYEIGEPWAFVASHPLKEFEQARPKHWMQLDYALRTEAPLDRIAPDLDQAGRVHDYRAVLANHVWSDRRERPETAVRVEGVG